MCILIYLKRQHCGFCFGSYRKTELSPHAAETCVQAERKHCNADSPVQRGSPCAPMQDRRGLLLHFFCALNLQQPKQTVKMKWSVFKQNPCFYRGVWCPSNIPTSQATFCPPVVFFTHTLSNVKMQLFRQHMIRHWTDNACIYTLKYFNHILANDRRWIIAVSQDLRDEQCWNPKNKRHMLSVLQVILHLRHAYPHMLC